MVLWGFWGTFNVNLINLLFTWQVGKAQLIVCGSFVVVTSEQVIPFQHVSRVCWHVELSFAIIWWQPANAWIYTRTVRPHIQKDGKTGKDEPKPDVGGQDVALVVIVQAPCRRCLLEKGGQRGNHERGPACGMSSNIKVKEVLDLYLQQRCRSAGAAVALLWAACRFSSSATCWRRSTAQWQQESPTPEVLQSQK